MIHNMPKSNILISFLLVSLLFFVSCETGPSLVIDGEKSYLFTDRGGTQNLVFTCNRDWFISSSESWCTVSPSSGTANEGSCRASIICEPNLTYEPRSCVLAVNIEGIKETIAIEQNAAEGLILSPSSFDVSSDAQSIEVVVQANVEYAVTIPAECEKWVSRTSSKGLTSSKLFFSIAENTEYDSREGKIIITQKNGSLSGTITIRQEQKDGLFVDIQNYEVSEENQMVSVTVKANVEYEVLSEVEWIKFMQTKALNETTATLFVESNSSTFSRTGKVLFKQKDGRLSHIVSITQQARPTITTEDASSISLFGSSLNGSLVVESATEITSSVWFLYSSSVSSLEELKSEGTKVVSSLDKNGRFTKELTGLSMATTYYFVACAAVNGRYYYGQVQSFITADISAIVLTEQTTNIGYSSGQLNGSLKTLNADSFSKDVWFLYSQSASTIDELLAEGIRISSSLSDSGAFTTLLEDLDYGTTYYYAACARVHDKMCFGEVRSFSTQGFSADVTTTPATNLTLYKASLHGIVCFNNADTLPKHAGFIISDKAQKFEELIAEGTDLVAEIDIDNGFRTDLSELKCGTKYYYVARVKVYDKEFYGEVRTFSTKQLPEGAVDMGLSVAWASCNIDANSPEEYGGYYAWGETETKEKYDWDTYRWGDADKHSLTKYNSDKSWGQVDHNYVLDIDDDVARFKLGDNWRTPSRMEFQELIDSCSWVWMEYKGVNGYTVTSTKNGNKLFFPSPGRVAPRVLEMKGNVGYYWTNSLSSSKTAFYLEIDSTRSFISSNLFRCYGFSIRAVTE